MKHILQVTYHGWLSRHVWQFDADKCKHDVSSTGHLIVRCDKGIVFAAPPGRWHEAVVMSAEQAKAEVAGAVA
jgi:hypothetical protein